jgi:AcrR family transcriptional regulator
METAKPPKRTRPMRADAVRNRERIIAVARRLLEEQGPDVEMDEVAKHAGVGVASIYRQFPSKAALVRSVLANHIEPLIETARAKLGAADAGAAFFEHLAFLADELLAKGNVHLAMARAGSSRHPAAAQQHAFQASLQALLSRAQRAGAVRPDVKAEEVILLMRGALFPGDGQDITLVARRRMFEIVCNGLRHGPSLRRRR